MADDDWPWDPATDKFGFDELVAAHRHPERVKQLLEDGHSVTPNAVLAACYMGDASALDLLLVAAPCPDVRLPNASRDPFDARHDWSSGDVAPHFGTDKREWFPLQHAASCLMTPHTAKAAYYSTVDTLLAYKPDLFATFRQPIWAPFAFPFPGEELPEIEHAPQSHPNGDPDRAEEEADQEEDLEDPLDTFPMEDGEWLVKPTPERGYGVRSVVHSLLEDGAYVKPILERSSLAHSHDLERRDPQGRTLLHCACRSALGADARLDATMHDAICDPLSDGVSATERTEASLFDTVRSLGVDILAKDSSGKHALHHLLEARSPHPYPMRPPLIKHTFAYVLRHAPSLINEPDVHDNYPLHTALQRLRGFLEESVWLEHEPLEARVHDLLDAGADPTVRDGRGNTALHYLADNGVAEQWRSANARYLLKRFCAAGVDANARNKLGRSAAEYLVDDDGKRHADLVVRHLAVKTEPPTLEALDMEVFSVLDVAGLRWAEQDARGRTLLHIVAKHTIQRAQWRATFLMSKGVDPTLKDENGKTAEDVAARVGNSEVLALLRGGS